MEITMTFDPAPLYRVLDAAKKHVAIEMREVVRGEGAAVAKTCLKWSPSPPKEKTLKLSAYREAFLAGGGEFNGYAYPVRITSGRRGGVPGRVFTTFNHTYHDVGYTEYGTFKIPTGGFHLKKERWNEFLREWGGIKSDYRSILSDKKKMSGMTKASWLQVIVHGLRYSMEEARQISPKGGITKKIEALALDRGLIDFGRSTWENKPYRITLYIRNLSRVAYETDTGKLGRAVRSREKAITVAMDKGVGRSFEKLAKRFPYVRRA